jgi:hypothetical protein
MSETVRIYTGIGNAPVRRRRKLSTRAKGIFFLLVLLVAAYAWWVTRDTYPIERLIPAGQTYQIFAGDLFRMRDALAQSKILKALPPEAGLGDISATLSGNVGIPEWILNNLIPDLCIASGKDLRTLADALFVTRMTRIGCLLTKFAILIPDVGAERAGGLNLLHISPEGIYFAVRGRILAASRSRDALIRALTVRPEDAEPREAMIGILTGISANDLLISLSLKPNDPLADAFDRLNLTARIEPASWRIKCSGALRKEWRERLGGFVEDLAPTELMAPPEGILQISANFNKPMSGLWPVAAELAGKRSEAESLWRAWSTPAPDAPLGPAQIGTALVGQLGPGIRISWCGFDLNEMVPVPQVVATFDADPEAISAMFTSLPPLASGADRYSMKPQYDVSMKCVRWPLVGGPSMEPTAGIIGNVLLISSSRTIAETFLNAGPTKLRLSQKGNLYLTLEPGACAKALVDLAALLAENDLLKGYTPDRVRQTAAPWMTVASAVKDITVIAACEKGEVTLDLAVNAN